MEKLVDKILRETVQAIDEKLKVLVFQKIDLKQFSEERFEL